MSDKHSPLILEALARAAIEPRGMSPYTSKSEPGLFPNTAIGKAAAKRCLEENMFRIHPATTKGKARELFAITDRGLRYLTEHGSPKNVLEDLLRTLEQRREQVDDLLATALRMAESIDALKSTVSAILPQVTMTRVPMPVNRLTESFEPVPKANDLAAAIQTHLADWVSEASRDCPLPDLYRAISCGHANCTIGQFHEALRKLHDAGTIYLHPWTGPLYAVPEPTFGLLVGHNVAYYASTR